MQLFIISPFAVLLLHRFKAKAVIASVALIFGCIALTVALHVHYDLTLLCVLINRINATLHLIKDSFKSHSIPFQYRLANRKIEIAYFPTHVRYSSWLIGILTGYIFVEFPRDTIRNPRVYFPQHVKTLSKSQLPENSV